VNPGEERGSREILRKWYVDAHFKRECNKTIGPPRREKKASQIFTLLAMSDYKVQPESFGSTANCARKRAV
jgi:hypothetical protein